MGREQPIPAHLAGVDKLHAFIPVPLRNVQQYTWPLHSLQGSKARLSVLSPCRLTPDSHTISTHSSRMNQ